MKFGGKWLERAWRGYPISGFTLHQGGVVSHFRRHDNLGTSTRTPKHHLVEVGKSHFYYTKTKSFLENTKNLMEKKPSNSRKSR